jgi:hypothetical protein
MAIIGFEEFGRRFVEQVVTADRVEATLANVVAGEFETEVKQAGGLVRAQGSGRVKRIDVDALADGLTEETAITFRARLHLDMSLTLKVSGMPYRYIAKGLITLELRPVLHDDLSIFVEVPDVEADQVELDLRPLGTVAALLDQLGGVEEQVRREIVRFVNQRKDEPQALEQRTIDLKETIEAEWSRRSAT